MTAMVASTEAPAIATALPGAIAELARCPVSALNDDDPPKAIGQAERARRRLEALDAMPIAEVRAGDPPGRYALRGSKHLLAGLLTLSPAESAALARQAHHVGRRRSCARRRT